MKRTLLLPLLTLLCTTLFAQGQSRIETFTVPSTILGTEKTCTVYLPAGYDASTEQYPVLYLLHGAYGCHTDWTTKGDVQRIADDAIAQGMACRMIIVMPDASGEGENYAGPHMGYFDVPGWSYERFFFEEFLPAVEQHYRIRGDRTHRAIAGLSMGGGGSAAYAIKHPELFGSACPLSGLLDAFPDGSNYEDVFVRSVVDNSPVKLLRELSDEQLAAVRNVRWWVDCGDDDFLYSCNIRFYALMRERNVPLQYRMRDGGHTWHYWRTGLEPILTFISQGFTEGEK